MSSSPITYENKSFSSERRSVSREPLKWVVLVYFGLDNWGKLIDLSESGMRFEFAQPPSDREKINFTFEAMGCLPGPSGGEIISDSFQAVGDVRWTRDFERTAGVQFAILPEQSRQQIRKWLSFDTSSVSVSANAIAEPQATAQVREPAEALPARALAPWPVARLWHSLRRKRRRCQKKAICEFVGGSVRVEWRTGLQRSFQNRASIARRPRPGRNR